MGYKIQDRDQHFQSKGPKRILALDGGGLRGIMSAGMLKQVEDILRKRHGGKKSFRLSHYFDLIAGTSTGSIIAAGLATGMTVDEIIGQYHKLGRKVFKKTFFRRGVLRAQYSSEPLTNELKKIFGASTKLRDSKLQTGLLIVTKRLDSGSPWPIGNNPAGRYFDTDKDSSTIANGDYPLWKVIRASTAAPSYFEGEEIEIAKGTKTKKAVSGNFVDGGVSPYNNPSLQALMYATLKGHGINWKTGDKNLLITSIGTGTDLVVREKSDIEAANGLAALQSLMDDNAALMELMLQWMSNSPVPTTIDRELGDLSGDLLGNKALLSYMRYNIPLTYDFLTGELGLDVTAEQAKNIAALDAPDNMPLLESIGTAMGKSMIKPEHFPAAFDLK